MGHISDLVARLAQDPAAVDALRHDPEALSRSLNLDATHVTALRTVDTFSASDQPVLDHVAMRKSSTSAGVADPVAVITPVSIGVGSIDISGDTGTLRTGPTTGTFAMAETCGDELVGPASPSPSVPMMPPSTPPPRPGWTPPSVPGAGPGVAPATPTVLLSPVLPCPPPAPAGPWPPISSQPQPCPATPFTCDAGPAAISAIVGISATTAQTAITAITAIAAMRGSGCRTTCQHVEKRSREGCT